jgi:hypothetical protein
MWGPARPHAGMGVAGICCAVVAGIEQGTQIQGGGLGVRVKGLRVVGLGSGKVTHGFGRCRHLTDAVAVADAVTVAVPVTVAGLGVAGIEQGAQTALVEVASACSKAMLTIEWSPNADQVLGFRV